jgi:hypothetical protein
MIMYLFGILYFGHCDLFVICVLGFGISIIPILLYLHLVVIILLVLVLDIIPSNFLFAATYPAGTEKKVIKANTAASKRKK